MPTVHRLGSLWFMVYLNDHRPAHVHVAGEGHTAIFELNYPSGPPELRVNIGFPRGRLKRIAQQVELHLVRLCLAWREMHGDY